MLLLALPFVILAVNRGVANWSDLDAFARWSMHMPARGLALAPLSASVRTVYRDTDCNYPPLGALASAGAMAGLRRLQTATGWTGIDTRQLFRGYLAAVEGLCVVLLFEILRRLAVPHPAWLAAGVYLLPSSWAGGAVWGQIDVVATLFALAAALSFLAVTLTGVSSPRSDPVVMATGAAALVGALATKQTALFSVPGLLALGAGATVAIFHRQGAARAARAAGLAVTAAIVIFLALDRLLLEAPAGHHGITTYVWTTGAWHTNKLSGNGPNVWTFLGRPNASSSDVPFFFSLTPRQVGDALFAGVVVLLLTLLVGALWRTIVDRRRFAHDALWLCALLLIFTGLTNLAMGILIAGTHERHMVQAFPFLLLGSIALAHDRPSRTARLLVTVAVAAAVVYGAFVYGILRGAPWLDQTATAGVLLAAFVVLAGGYAGVLRAPTSD